MFKITITAKSTSALSTREQDDLREELENNWGLMEIEIVNENHIGY
jgi:hypothetical protein